METVPVERHDHALTPGRRGSGSSDYRSGHLDVPRRDVCVEDADGVAHCPGQPQRIATSRSSCSLWVDDMLS